MIQLKETKQEQSKGSWKQRNQDDTRNNEEEELKKVKDLKRKESQVCNGREIKKRQTAVAVMMSNGGEGERRWSTPLGLTIRVNSSPHWGRRRAPGTLDHYRGGWCTPTHRRGPIWISCYDQTIHWWRYTSTYAETKSSLQALRHGRAHWNDRCTTASIFLVHMRDVIRKQHPLLSAVEDENWPNGKRTIGLCLPWRAPAGCPELGLKRGARRSLSCDIKTASLGKRTKHLG